MYLIGLVGLADLTDQELDPGLTPCMLLHQRLLPEALVLLTLMTIGLSLTLASDCDDDTDCPDPGPAAPRQCCEDNWCTENDYQGREGLCCTGQICRKRSCSYSWQCGLQERCEAKGSGGLGQCRAVVTLFNPDLELFGSGGSGSGQEIGTLSNQDGFWDMED